LFSRRLWGKVTNGKNRWGSEVEEQNVEHLFQSEIEQRKGVGETARWGEGEGKRTFKRNEHRGQTDPKTYDRGQCGISLKRVARFLKVGRRGGGKRGNGTTAV